MKIGVFSTVRGGTDRFKEACDKYAGELELIDLGFPATDEDVVKVEDCEAIIYTPWKEVSEIFWKTLSEKGVKYILTCTAGYDHFNLELIKKYNMKATYVPAYSPNAISEHTVMLVLALLRKFRKQVHNIDDCNYQIAGLMGKEIRKQTIGIVGAGRIGLTTMKCLSGFQPQQILAYDLYQNDEVKEYAKYVDMYELYQNSDIIIFHCNLNKENYHMINEDTLEKLKDGVILINVARGALFDTKCLVKGIDSGKIGGLGLDVIEEEQLLKGNQKFTQSPINELETLLKYDNVIFTSHSAFFTETAYEDMSNITISNAYEYKTTNMCKYELVGE